MSEEAFNQSYEENGNEEIATEQFSERSTRRSAAQKKQQQQKQMTTLKIKVSDLFSSFFAFFVLNFVLFLLKDW